MSDTDTNAPDQGTAWPNPLAPPPGRTQAPLSLPYPQPPAQARPPAYIPTRNQPGFAGRQMAQLGTPDATSAGMQGYPQGSYPNTPFMPQPNDIPTVMNGLVTGLGRWGSPAVANPMLQAGLSFQGVTKEYAAGQKAALDIQLERMRINTAQAEIELQKQLRDYAEAYHLYGEEKDETGKVTKPAELNKLRDKIMEFAYAHNDRTLYNAAYTNDMKAVESYLTYLDGQHGDLDKLNKLLGTRQKQEQIEEGETAKRIRGTDPNAPYKGQPEPGSVVPEGTTPPAPANPPPDDTGSGGAGKGDGGPGGVSDPSAVPAPYQPPAKAPRAPDEQGRAAPQQQVAANQPQEIMSDVQNPIADALSRAGIRPGGGAGAPAAPTPPAGQPSPPISGPQTAQGPQAPQAPQNTGGITFERVEEQPPRPDVERTPQPGEKPKDWKAPQLYPMPDPPDYSGNPDIQLSSRQIKYYADNYMRTRRRQFFGGSGKIGSAQAAKQEQIIENYAALADQYANNVIKNIGARDPELAFKYLDGVMPGMSAIVKSIAKGQSPIPTGYAANSQFWNTAKSMAYQINPNLTAADFPLYQRTVMTFNDGRSYVGQAILGTNRALEHAAYAMELFDVQHNGNTPLSNRARQWLQTQFGDPRAVTFNAVLTHVAQELTRAFRGNGGALRDIERELNNINSASSPDQAAGYFKAVTNLLYGQLDSINDLWKRGTKDNTHHPLDFLSEGGYQAWNYIRSKQSAYDPVQSSGYNDKFGSIDLSSDALAEAESGVSWQLGNAVISILGDHWNTPPDLNSPAVGNPRNYPDYGPEPPTTNIYTGQ